MRSSAALARKKDSMAVVQMIRMQIMYATESATGCTHRGTEPSKKTCVSAVERPRKPPSAGTAEFGERL